MKLDMSLHEDQIPPLGRSSLLSRASGVVQQVLDDCLSRFARSQTSRAREQRYREVMAAADEVARIEPQALPALARMIARPLQATFVGEPLRYRMHDSRLSNDPDSLFFGQGLPITPEGRSLADLWRDKVAGVDQTENSHALWLTLSRDVVVPGPWNRERLVNCVSTIGRMRRDGPWEQDNNHQVSLMLPFGLGIVNGGNHSIAVGICNGEGAIMCDHLIDFSLAYDHVQYDGSSFMRSSDGKVLNHPKFEEPGMLFEIGRRMTQLRVAYDALAVTKADRDALGRDSPRWRYAVWINGQDAGVDASTSAVERALQAEGFSPSDALWGQVLREGARLTRTGPFGEEEHLEFFPVGPRPELNDLKWVSPRPVSVD